MSRFLVAHGAHADAGRAIAQAAARIDEQAASLSQAFRPTLGIVYLGDPLGAQAPSVLAGLQRQWPGVAWVGCTGVGVIAGGTEFIGEPALALMLTDLPARDFALFSGRRPLDPRHAFSALVHADPTTHELGELIDELAARTASGYLFGGLASGHACIAHFADEVLDGGLSGVAFASEVALVSRVTQGSQPVGPTRRITACERNLVQRLDDQSAMHALFADLGMSIERPRRALGALRRTLVGLTDADQEAIARGGQFGPDTRVRHLLGIDPVGHAIAVSDHVQVGQQLAFCRRDADAARRDLVRICAEIRDEIDVDEPALASAPAAADPASPRIAGAIYVSCSGRGGRHFGAPSAEAQVVQHALGDVPLIGFFAAGEVARHHLYGYTGVLTVFVG